MRLRLLNSVPSHLYGSSFLSSFFRQQSLNSFDSSLVGLPLKRAERIAVWTGDGLGSGFKAGSSFTESGATRTMKSHLLVPTRPFEKNIPMGLGRHIAGDNPFSVLRVVLAFQIVQSSRYFPEKSVSWNYRKQTITFFPTSENRRCVYPFYGFP